MFPPRPSQRRQVHSTAINHDSTQQIHLCRQVCLRVRCHSGGLCGKRFRYSQQSIHSCRSLRKVQDNLIRYVPPIRRKPQQVHGTISNHPSRTSLGDVIELLVGRRVLRGIQLRNKLSASACARRHRVCHIRLCSHLAFMLEAS